MRYRRISWEGSGALAEVWVGETSDKVSKLWAVVEGLNWTVDGKRARVLELLESKLIGAQ